ncbi:hypothetical protein [Sphingobium aromaticiconvertens]|uniref:hypothetical protein n=1 Tax=Sphingobium aromaticiconvertens TaxID=365341 RepID=UPI00301AE698
MLPENARQLPRAITETVFQVPRQTFNPARQTREDLDLAFASIGEQLAQALLLKTRKRMSPVCILCALRRERDDIVFAHGSVHPIFAAVAARVGARTGPVEPRACNQGSVI